MLQVALAFSAFLEKPPELLFERATVPFPAPDVRLHLLRLDLPRRKLGAPSCVGPGPADPHVSTHAPMTVHVLCPAADASNTTEEADAAVGQLHEGVAPPRSDRDSNSQPAVIPGTNALSKPPLHTLTRHHEYCITATFHLSSCCGTTGETCSCEGRSSPAANDALRTAIRTAGPGLWWCMGGSDCGAQAVLIDALRG